MIYKVSYDNYLFLSREFKGIIAYREDKNGYYIKLMYPGFYSKLKQYLC